MSENYGSNKSNVTNINQLWRTFFIFCFFFIKSCQSEIIVNYIVTDVGSDCLSVCNENSLECYDNVIQEMSCEEAAAKSCSNNQLKDSSGSYHCDKGGCYIDCEGEIYASRGTKYWTCNTQPICHDMGQYVITGTFSQICPCAYEVKSDTSIHLLMWQIIGLVLFFSCCALGTVQVLAICFPNLFPSKESVYQKMGYIDSKVTWSEWFHNLLISLKNTGDNIKDMFTKKTNLGDSVHSTASLSNDTSSEQGSDVEDPSSRARKERKERRSKKKKGQHSQLSSSDLDDSVDM